MNYSTYIEQLGLSYRNYMEQELYLPLFTYLLP